MGRPRQVTNEAIIDAARSCAEEHGPAVSLDVIAERVGVTAPALLKRFGNRQTIMLAALRADADPEWLRDLADGPDDRPLEAQLATVLEAMIVHFDREVPRMCALRESGIPFDQIYSADRLPPPIRGLHALAAWLGRARTRGLLVGDHLETAAQAMLGALQSRMFVAHVLRRSFGQRSQRQFVVDLAALFSRALAPKSSRQPSPRRPRRGAR